MTRSKRFELVELDKVSFSAAENVRKLFEELEITINSYLPDSRAKSLCITELEKAQMWVNKALRDETVKRKGDNNAT